MKPFIKLVKTTKPGNYTLALVRETIHNEIMDNPFSTTDTKTTIIICNAVTGEDIKEKYLLVEDLSDKVSIKLDGKVVPLTPSVRTGITYTETQLAALGDYELVSAGTVANSAIINDPTYLDFKTRTLEAMGLGVASAGDLIGFLATYEGKKHVLVTGDAGLGKTFAVSKFAEEGDRRMFFKSLDNGTEVIDLLGNPIKISDGSFPWKDGIITQAFRAAAKGEKVLLFIDELLRAPDRELSILIGCLTPDSRGKLVLRTGRPLESTLIDGIIDEEVIETDIEHLWCVSTTNQGRGYNTGRIDMALKDRFRIYEQTMSNDVSRDIALEVLKKTSYGSKLSDTAANTILDKIYKVVEAVTTHVEGDGKLKQYITIRHITEVLKTSNKVKDIKPRMLDLVSNLVMIDSSGKLNVEQKEIVKEYINKYVKV
jgi:hypothetical protein